jgi:ABC-type bacteriocin/lantibiotic exporter with double-glycine peptidase domain
MSHDNDTQLVRLAIDVHRSRYFAWSQAAVIVASLCIVVVTLGALLRERPATAWLVPISFALLLVLSFFALRASQRQVAKQLTLTSGRNIVLSADGKSQEMRLSSQSFCTHWFAVLVLHELSPSVHWRQRFYQAIFPQTLLVMRDSVTPDEYRRLVILVDWAP